MLNRKSFILILGITFILFCSNNIIELNKEVLPLFKDELKEAAIDLRPLNLPLAIDLDLNKLNKTITRLLQATQDTKNNTSNQNQLATPESSKKWKSRINYEERKEYEGMLKIKSSFQASLNFLPKKYQPESSEYIMKVSAITLAFTTIAILFLLLVIFFLVMRFCCNKCKGPLKPSQVSRGYRNITWFIMIGSLVSLIVVYIFLLTFSFKINNALNEAGQMINDNATEIETEHISLITNLTKEITEKFPQFDNDNFNQLMTGLNNYSNNTHFRLGNLTSYENVRSLVTILIFVFYLIVINLAFLAFFKRWANFLLGISIILLLSIPILLFFEGIIASYYFIYSDICQEVHNAIYAYEFPIADKGLGYLVSCFNAKTKSDLYSYAYQVEQVESEVRLLLANNLTSSKDFEIYSQIQKDIKIVKEGPLNDLMSCNHVYDSVLFFEQRFCASGMSWSNNLMSSYSWLILIILLSAYSINRMKPVVEKKQSEIESMLMNEDVIE